MARDAGAKLVVDSDAHRVAELDFVRYGIDQARRGWCEAKDVANTLPLARLLPLLRTGARPATTAGRVTPSGRPARPSRAARGSPSSWPR
jgi:DNA polymerase (family 10)